MKKAVCVCVGMILFSWMGCSDREEYVGGDLEVGDRYNEFEDLCWEKDGDIEVADDYYCVIEGDVVCSYKRFEADGCDW